MLSDEPEKRRRGYTDPRSKVRMDGTEVLYGHDWTRRKKELARRSGGRCEVISSDGERCRSAAVDAHHLKPRSHGRSDALANLLHVCRLHHSRLDWKKLKWTPKSERN